MDDNEFYAFCLYGRFDKLSVRPSACAGAVPELTIEVTEGVCPDETTTCVYIDRDDIARLHTYIGEWLANTSPPGKA